MATYRSSLIEALRGRSQGAMPSMSTVSLLPNPVVSAAPFVKTSRKTARRGIFNPVKLTMTPAVVPPPAQTQAPQTQQIRPEEFIQMLPDVGGGDGGGGSGQSDAGYGGYGVGQGVNTDLADLGLSLMAYGEAGKGLAPGSLAAGVAGSVIAGQQADAMGRAADTLAAIEAQDVPGVVSVADRHGNVFGYSSPATIAASDAATFGTSLSSADEAVAQAMADYAESAPSNVDFSTIDAAMSLSPADAAIATAMADYAEAGGGSLSGGLAAADGVGMSGFDGTGNFGGDGGGGDGGGCFLTTAAVEHMGQDDDGDVLNTLRKFRDQFMLKDDSKRNDVAAYYKHAPQIVEALNARPDAKNVYREMYETYILPAVDAIKSGDNDKAYEAYVAGVDWAMKQAANAQ